MTEETRGGDGPDTVVLVHGLWMTPRCWEGWVPYYEAKGYRVLTPAYPGFEVEVEALRENPQVIADATVPATVDHLAAVVESCDRPPIIMGHSFGGLSQDSTTAARWSTVAGTVASAITCGFSRSASTSISNPG